MAKTKSRKRNSVLKVAVKALQRSLSHPVDPFRGDYLSEEDLEEASSTGIVPEDVKEGHFAVLAVRDDKPKRFVVSLSCLSHPMFLRLLEQAEEEFGFRQEGTLAIPCRSSELERIIGEL